MTSNSKTFDYLSLPGEIRNQIMQYVLLPGDIYPQSSMPIEPGRISQSSTSLWLACSDLLGWPAGPLKNDSELAPEEKREMRDNKLPSIPFLVASKQMFEEGERFFYECNTFHLPRGSVEAMRTWINQLSPRHKAMIKSVCLTLTLADVTAPVLSAFNEWRRDAGMDGAIRVHLIADDVLEYLRKYVWRQKLDLLAEFETLETVHMKTTDQTNVIEVGKMQEPSCELKLFWKPLMQVDNNQLRWRESSKGRRATLDWLSQRDRLSCAG